MAKASIDGYWNDYIYEVKLCGADKIAMIKDNKIPDNFYVQVQWQIWVTKAKGAYICAIPFRAGYCDVGKVIFSELIKFDRKFFDTVIWPKATEFFKKILTYRQEQEKKENSQWNLNLIDNLGKGLY